MARIVQELARLKNIALAAGVSQEEASNDQILEALARIGLDGDLNIAMKSFITVNPEMERLKLKAKILSKTSDPVLIYGESGTGKELIAKILHGDRTGSFITLNCAAVQDTLIEAELFGTAKGGFTDSKDRKGLVDAAEEGTIFFDEINSASPSLQAKILRLIDKGEYRAVGDVTTRQADCRFVFATNVPLEECNFRPDLRWRISIFLLKLTPLVQRREDIIPIATYLGYQSSMGEIPEEALEGNVRTLYAWVRRKQVFSDL